MTEIRLSSRQREIVESPDGPILVLAGAGSGKTRVLTERVRHLLTSRSGTFKVLALTFTNKAAEEMRVRLKSIGELQERTFIGTIHKFCLEIIRSKGSMIGIDEMPHIFERETDRLEILLQAFNENPSLKVLLDEIELTGRPKFLANVLNYISQKKKDLLGIAPGSESDEDETDLQIFNEYNEVLTSQNAIDFDDVICIAYKILVDRPKVSELYRRMYKFICVDEAQDLNFAQYELIKALCGNENQNVLMVGDPNQAIYGFNGSDKLYMTKFFLEDFGANEIHLTENYRSSYSVLSAANKLIPGAVDVANVVVKGEFQIKECENERKEAKWIADKIEKLLSAKYHEDIEGKVTSDKIAVLARNKYVFNCLEQELVKKKLPFFFKKNSDLSDFESDLIKIYDLGMRVLVNPHDTLHLQQLCKILKITKLRSKKNAEGLSKLENIKNEISDNEFRNDFETLLEGWKFIESNINNFPKAVDLINNYVDKSENYSGIPNKRLLVIKDLEELRALWKQYSLQAQTDTKTLANFRNQIALGIPSTKNVKDLGITLGTVHSVKGLEFEIVFVMGLNDGTFPDYRAVKQGPKALNEEKNNVFVAFTRSRRLLYLTYPTQKFMPWDKETPVSQQASRFIRALL